MGRVWYGYIKKTKGFLILPRIEIFCYADKERLPSENDIVDKCLKVIRA